MKIIKRIYLYFLLVIPIILLGLPSDCFDSGQTICLSVLLFGQECFACGLTKGIQHLLHLDFSCALHFNPLSFIVLPVLVWIWIKEIRRARKYTSN